MSCAVSVAIVVPANGTLLAVEFTASEQDVTGQVTCEKSSVEPVEPVDPPSKVSLLSPATRVSAPPDLPSRVTGTVAGPPVPPWPPALSVTGPEPATRS
jgi:hypothetical protein